MFPVIEFVLQATRKDLLITKKMLRKGSSVIARWSWCIRSTITPMIVLSCAFIRSAFQLIQYEYPATTFLLVDKTYLNPSDRYLQSSSIIHFVYFLSGIQSIAHALKSITQIHQTLQATVWQHLMSLFHGPYTCLQLCSEDFCFLSPARIFYIWLVGIQKILHAQKMFGVIKYLSTMCGPLPSTRMTWVLSGSLVWWCRCHKFSDLPFRCVSEKCKSPLGGLHPSLLIYALLRSDARTIEGEECARLHTSCESSKQFSVQISSTLPLVSFLWAYAFLFVFTVF